MSDLGPRAGVPSGQQRPTRMAAKVAKSAITEEVKLIKKIANKDQREKAKKRKAAAKNKEKQMANKKRHASTTGGKKKGSHLFPGYGNRMDGNNPNPHLNAISHDIDVNKIKDEAVAILFKQLHRGRGRDGDSDEVHKLKMRNIYVDCAASLVTGKFFIGQCKGGMELKDGGKVLGKKEDYEEDCEEHRVAEDRNVLVEPGKLCFASFPSFVANLGQHIEDEFIMMSKLDVDRLIMFLFDNPEFSYRLGRDSLPSSPNLFWSMAYHYIYLEKMEEAKPKGLLDIYKKICGKRDWESVEGVGDRKKTKRDSKKSGTKSGNLVSLYSARRNY